MAKYQKRVKNVNQKSNRLTNLVAKLQADLDVANQAITEVEMTKTEYENFLKEVPSQSEKQKLETIRKLRVTNRQLSKKVNESKKKIEEANEKCSAAMTVNSRNEMTLANYRKQLADTNSQLMTAVKKLSRYEKQNSVLENKVKKFNQSKLDMQREVALKKKRTMELAIVNKKKGGTKRTHYSSE